MNITQLFFNYGTSNASYIHIKKSIPKWKIQIIIYCATFTFANFHEKLLKISQLDDHNLSKCTPHQK